MPNDCSDSNSYKVYMEAICERVGITSPVYVLRSINRPNLYYTFINKRKTHEVNFKNISAAAVAHLPNSAYFLQRTLQPIIDGLKEKGREKTILFERTKDTATCLWDMLKVHGGVGIHHSSLEAGTRRKTADDFRSGKLTVIICTIGFGMVSLNKFFRGKNFGIMYIGYKHS